MNQTKIWLKHLSKVESPQITYADESFPVVLKKGSGMHLWDVDGNRYTDFTACFGVAALGHRPSVALTAMRKQAAQLIHGMGDVHPTESKIRFLTLLAQLLPYSRPHTILSSTGSEAVETALKSAVLVNGKSKFIAFDGAYHGLLTGPLRLNSRQIFTSGFSSWMQNPATILPFPFEEHASLVLEQLDSELRSKSYAGIVLELVQGRGGDRAMPTSFVQEASRLAKKYHALLIIDEVFTGFGRTGKMFAFEHYDIVPDILCLGKAMGGGLPLSACVGDVLEVWGKSKGEARHTSTFLGHPLACAVGHATVKEIQARLPKWTEELNLIEGLTSASDRLSARIPRPFQITGKGFMKGIWFYREREGFAFTLAKKLLGAGFMVLPCGERADVLSLTPPLIARVSDYERLLRALEKMICEVD